MKKLLKLFATTNVLATQSLINETTNSKSYPKEVLAIHNEFETAADKLLEEANKTLEQAAKADVNKVSRLESLGFKQANQVTELRPLIQQAQLSKEQIELLNYYKQNYPLNKFITEEQVKAICYKYNLVCGPVNRFKGFVPEKNLKQIESFKLKKDDELDDLVVFIEKTGKIENLNWSKVIHKEEILFKINYVKKSDYCYISSSVSPHTTYPDYTKLVNKKTYTDRNFQEQLMMQCGLQICAPVKDMDITGLELTEGYKLTKKHIPDPVVLQPVKGGYLILTAWGDEASDPLVINEINN